MKNVSNLKKQNGSITLFVLVSMVFFTTILGGLYINSNNKLQKQNRELNEIQKNYRTKEINELYYETYNELKEMNRIE